MLIQSAGILYANLSKISEHSGENYIYKIGNNVGYQAIPMKCYLYVKRKGFISVTQLPSSSKIYSVCVYVYVREGGSSRPFDYVICRANEL